MTTTTSALRLDRSQLSKALKGDPEVVRQFELLIARVNAFGSGDGTGAVDSVNGQTGVVVLDIPNITSGTAAPSGGVDGDIYLQYT